MSIAYTVNVFGFNTNLDFAIDDTDPNYTYIGYTRPGTAKSSPGWMIIRMTKADSGNSNLNSGRWADGQEWSLQNYNTHTWDNRATYNYAS